MWLFFVSIYVASVFQQTVMLYFTHITSLAQIL